MSNEDIAMLIQTDPNALPIEREGSMLMFSPLMGTQEFDDELTIQAWRKQS